MDNWKFTDEYANTYPALKNSILSLLVFSEHSQTGDSFAGTLDVAASGAALETLGWLVNLTEIKVSGTVTETGDTLTVALESTDAAAFTQGIANSIPLIGGEVTKAASLGVDTVTTKTDDPDDAPKTDAFDLKVTLAIGSARVEIVSQIPMHGGLFSLTGEFSGVGITLDDLGFLMGSSSSGNSWFPTEQLGPYAQGQPSFGLLGMGLTCYIHLKPFSVAISSVTVSVGISKLPIKGNALYLDPLAVWVTVGDPTKETVATWGLVGSAKLCNYANPGPGGLSEPDFAFDFAMGFPPPDFSISGKLDNKSNKTVKVMLQDLLEESTDVGLPEHLTVDKFDFAAAADIKTGKVTSFSTEIAMSGGFGLFEGFVLESISIGITYSGS